MGDLTEFRPKPVAQTGSALTVTRENFWEKGRMMIAQMYPESAPVIYRGTPEYEAWEKYFTKHLRWRPWALKAVEAGSLQSMTVPTQWPEWFDTEYAKS